jgi:hypothetical protein
MAIVAHLGPVVSLGLGPDSEAILFPLPSSEDKATCREGADDKT